MLRDLNKLACLSSALLHSMLTAACLTAILATQAYAGEHASEKNGTQSHDQNHEEIRQAAADFLNKKLREQQRTDMHIEIGQLDNRLKLANCDQPLEAFVSSHSRLMGNAQVGVRCTSPKPWTLYITAKIAIYEQVVTAKHPLSRGTTLTSDDITLTRSELSRLHRGYLSATDQAIGRLLKHDLSQGAVLTPAQLKTPLLIRRGQKVTLFAEMEGIQVRMSGTALEDGANGELIRVKNLTSKRVIEGTVLKNGTIKVPL
jgi:flagella basal body P-ring formation protein FlgA